MKKIVFLLMGFFLGINKIFAQAGETAHADHHSVPFQKPDEIVADTIVWISVAVVVFTLILTLKYLFKPKEDNPDHIKYIVKDEGF